MQLPVLMSRWGLAVRGQIEHPRILVKTNCLALVVELFPSGSFFFDVVFVGIQFCLLLVHVVCCSFELRVCILLYTRHVYALIRYLFIFNFCFGWLCEGSRREG